MKLKDILLELLDEQQDDRCLRIARRKYDKPSAYRSGAIVQCRKGKIWKGLKEDESLHKWFSRKGAGGKSKGWVDCNTCKEDPKTGRKKCKPCGRQKGEKRSKYPSCRPTPSRCSDPGKGKKWGKTNESSDDISLLGILNEISLDLSNAYDYKFVGGENWKYEFEISTGTKYAVTFNKMNEEGDTYERVYFVTNKEIDPFKGTGENQALKVNATVMKITLDFLERVKDLHILYISPITKSRKKMVMTLLDKNLPSKYSFEEIENGDEIIIYKKK